MISVFEFNVICFFPIQYELILKYCCIVIVVVLLYLQRITAMKIIMRISHSVVCFEIFLLKEKCFSWCGSRLDQNLCVFAGLLKKCVYFPKKLCFNHRSFNYLIRNSNCVFENEINFLFLLYKNSYNSLLFAQLFCIR